MECRPVRSPRYELQVADRILVVCNPFEVASVDVSTTTLFFDSGRSGIDPIISVSGV
jgi:hypothetical protein